MKLSFPILALTATLAFLTSGLSADVVMEAKIGSGYQGNLFNNSNSTNDTYSSAGFGLKYYPAASTQVTASARYDAYAGYSDLSNFAGNLSVVFIPTSAGSALSLSIGGNMSMRRFGTLYELYDQVGMTIGVDATYRLAPWAYFLSSVSFQDANYTNSDFGSNRNLDLTTGLNFTLFGSNALAARVDYSNRSLDQPTLLQQSEGYSLANDRDNTETFEITGVTMRYSRPLGQRTGLNLSIGHRQLHLNDNLAVLGYTIDYLSPWSDLWEGTSYSGALKHFLPKQITTEISLAYYDKSYVDVIEVGEVTGETYWRDTRDDRLTTLSLLVSKPVSLQNGTQLTPSIYLGYRKNLSNTEFFDYEDVAASISLKVGL